MTCRDEILAAIQAIITRSNTDVFSADDVIREMRSRGTGYPDSTIRTYVVSVMCVNAPAHHTNRTPDLYRVDRGMYRLNQGNISVSTTTPTIGHVSTATQRVPVISASELTAHFSTYVTGREVDARYASFDFCYNHFQAAREADLQQRLADEVTLELSCLHLGFYLASWGMFRGSSELFKRSVHALVPVIRVISTEPQSSWEIDVGCYEDRLEDLLALCARVQQALPVSASDTLVTKTVLGVFGAVPAFDRFFREGFGVPTFNRRSLAGVSAFYERERTIVDSLPKIATIDFVTGEPTRRFYPVAKVLDMIFFERGRARVARLGRAPDNPESPE